MLAAALVGFVLLIELLSAVTSSGPDSLIAPIPSDDPSLSLPGIGGVFSYALTAAAIVVAAAGLLAYRSRLPSEEAHITRRPMVIAVGVALVFVVATAAVAFSGPLNPGDGLGEHLADRGLIPPVGVAVLTAFFMSVALVGVLRPNLLLVILIAWVVVGLATGILDLPGFDLPHLAWGSSGQTEQEMRGIDGRVFFVLMGFTLSLAVALVTGRLAFIVGCFLVWIVIGFLFVLFGPESLGGTVTEFDLPGGALFGPEDLTLIHGVIGALLAISCICLTVIGIFNFLRHQNRSRAEGAPVWSAMTRWIVGPIVLGLLFSMCTSPVLGGGGLGLGLTESQEDGDDEFREEVEKYRDSQDVFPLENGNFALLDGSSLLLQYGAVADGHNLASPDPLFTVTGAAHTTHLRSATGDVYENGSWTQLDPVIVSARAGQDIPAEVAAIISEGMVYQGVGSGGQATVLQPHRIVSELLVRHASGDSDSWVDQIVIVPVGRAETFTLGPLPVSIAPVNMDVAGSWRPFSGTFLVPEDVGSYQLRSLSVRFHERALLAAAPASDPTYHQLPASGSERIEGLASDITSGLISPYEKAEAIESHLRESYSYLELEEEEQAPRAPSGVDPVEWFLFDRKEGGSSAFSSAFVLLARSAGVPARVVSGWRIEPVAGTQSVTGANARQWAEIALEGLGWVTFDPTPDQDFSPAIAGAPDREYGPEGSAASELPDEERLEGSGSIVIPEQTKEDISELIGMALHSLLSSDDPAVRSDAALSLGGLGGESVLAALAEAALSDPNGVVREAAIQAVAMTDFDLLSDILLEHQDEAVRAVAAQGLAATGEDIALGPLTQALLNDLEPEVRQTAAAALGDLGDESALEPLVEALVNNPDSAEAVRAAAAQSLGQLGDAGAVGPLTGSLSEDPDESVRAASASALGELADVEGVEQLTETLGGGDSIPVRAAAALALGAIAASQSLPPLLDARAEDESSEVRSAASEALEGISTTELTEALASDDDPAGRAAAAELLGERGDPSTAPGLIEALTDPEPQVREAAGEAIGGLGTVTPLENGGGILEHSAGASFIPGVTTRRVSAPTDRPIFEVQGELADGFLRNAVGGLYVDGVWLSEEDSGVVYSAGDTVATAASPIPATVEPATVFLNRVVVRPVDGEGFLPTGVLPTSAKLEALSVDGTYLPRSDTFSTSQRVEAFDWISRVPAYSVAQLNAAAVSGNYPHATLPEGVPGRVRSLATEITAGHSTPYAKAKAIESYLRTSYTYSFANPGDGGPPDGHDPVDWFLFESREGTCGNFSSAFVLLARAVGLPARVVSGWSVLAGPAIADTSYEQTVYTDQAHQRAEVAFEGLGWIPFEPTASGGAPDRAPDYASEGGTQVRSERQVIESLVEGLASDDPAEKAQAQQHLENIGVGVIVTENGGAVVTGEGEGFDISAGTTSRQAVQPASGDPTEVFVVTGAAHTAYLRSAVGDVYQDGQWSSVDPLEINYAPGRSVPHLVRDLIAEAGPALAGLPPDRVSSSLLAGYEVDPDIAYIDTITVKASQQLGSIPAGRVPTSQFLSEVENPGVFYPFSATFELDERVTSYEWTSLVPQFSEAQLNAASAVPDPAYTQLPEGLPARIRELALEVTRGHVSPYAKAQALENFLSTQYTYRFAEEPGSGAPPEGRDPVDWFLFDYQEGTCGVFSSAFVVMARSIGIPARVVSGWAIGATAEPQTVRTGQAHQWAEIVLEGVGWVQFEPTAPQGPQSRVPEVQDSSSEDDSGATGNAIATVTDITVWPEEMQRRRAFTIGGTVRTATGGPVSGMSVEIYINETKDPGGIMIGETIVQDGSFSAEVSLPASALTGNYQLLARAVGNGQYVDSWSDPDVTVYSETGLQLTGPQEIAVDSQAVFTGKFLDDSGGGIPGATVLVTVDGRAIPARTTGPSGDFSFGHIFSEVGPHEVEVQFEGAEFLRGNSVRLDLTAVMPTVLTLDPLGQASLGESFTIAGSLRNVRGEPLSGADVSVTVAGGPPQTATTGDEGQFIASGVVEEFGEFEVNAEYLGEYPVLPSSSSTRSVAKDMATVNIAGPAVVTQGSSATFEGSIGANIPQTIGNAEVMIEDSDGALLEVVVSDGDGYFQYQTGPLLETGNHTISARLEEHDQLTASSASFSYSVTASTVLTIEGPDLAAAGATVELSGSLQGEAGQPVAGVPIWVGDAGAPSLVTGEDGRFTLDLQVNAELGEFDVQSVISVPFGFEGTRHLAPAIATHSITVGIPRLSLEQVGTVPRGETASIRGGVFVGNHPMSGAGVAVGQDVSTVTTETGSFAITYPIATDATLGSNVVTVSVPDFGLQSEVAILIKATASLTVVPVGDVRLGEDVVLQATLTDESGTGIAGAVLTTSHGDDGSTNGRGEASISLQVPDDDDLLYVPVTFNYAGDEFREPLTYLIAVPVTPASFNWFLWVGIPALLVAVVASAFAARRLTGVSSPIGAGLIPLRLRRLFSRRASDQQENEVSTLGPDGEALTALEPCSLEVVFAKPAPDLPDVWGVGESVTVGITLYADNGQGIQSAVEFDDPDGIHAVVDTDLQGGWSQDWTARELGEFSALASFAGNERFQRTSDSRELRVVDFREEIVRLYNSFEEWAVELVPGAEGRTPRELESMLVSSGMTFDFRALDEVISRFEEADYSEHDIGRRQYEAMYRSWARIVRR